MKIPLIDLRQQIRDIKPEIMQKIEELLDQANFIMGSEVQALESSFCSYLNLACAVSCNSGTDALSLILEAMEIGPGDEVITTPFTFFATAESISGSGARPVFADVDPETMNIDPEQVEKAITAKTKAIMPVHIFGQPADMEKILAVAQNHGLPVIEDACQAIGAACTFSDGTVKKVGAIGDAAAFSFYPTKNLGACGDGGMVTTNDARLAAIIKSLRVHGSGKDGKRAYEQLTGDVFEFGAEKQETNDTIYDPAKYYNFLIGRNSRLDAFQAAVVEIKMKRLDQWNRKRRDLSLRYNEELDKAGLSGRGFLVPQRVLPNVEPVYHLYVVKCERREALAEYLAGQGIATGIYYPVPLHLQKVYQTGRHQLGYAEGDLPESEWLSQRTLALPLFPEMTIEQQDYILQAIRNFYSSAG